MLFSLNDSVFYGVHGVCTITDISKREFCGILDDYYTLRPAFSEKSTVFVPVNRPDIADKMRRIHTKVEIRKLLDDLPSFTSFWPENASERKEKYGDLIKNGDISDLCTVIKSFYEHRKEMLTGNKKKMYASDEKYLADAEKMLFEEIAFVLDITREKAAETVKEKIGV